MRWSSKKIRQHLYLTAQSGTARMPLKVRVVSIPPNYITTSQQIHTRATTGCAIRTTETWHREPVVPKCMDSTAYPQLAPLALPFLLFQVCLMIDKGVPAGKKGLVIMAGALAGGSWSEGCVSLGWLQFAVNRLQGWKLVMGVQQKIFDYEHGNNSIMISVSV